MLSRILIISTNREMSPQPVTPAGAAWIAEALSQAGFDTRLLDLSFEKDPIRRVIKALNDWNPDGIGLSVRNADNGDFLTPRSFLPDVKEITEAIKENSSARIIIGGPGVSIMPREMLDYLGLEWACMGEGEEAVVAFFKAQKPQDVTDFPGIVSNNCLLCNERKEWISPDAVRPKLHGWVDVKRYLNFEPVLPVQGKRGCANNCLYCTYNRIEGRSWRLRDPAAVAEEISELVFRTGAHRFEFVDSIFNQPEGYMEQLLEELIRWDLKAKFHVSSMTPKGLTKKQVVLMERAGITAVGITPESAADETLSSLRKGFTEAEVQNAAELLKGSSIKALWCFLMGGPREDELTVKKTLDFINQRIPAKDKAFLTTGIRIYPHTGMHERALKEGVVSPSDSLLMPTFYFTEKLSPEEMRGIVKSRLADSRKVIFLSDTNFPSLGALRWMGTKLHLPSPFWSYANYMNLMLSGRRVMNRTWGR